MTTHTCTHAPVATLLAELHSYDLGCAGGPLGLEEEGCREDITQYAMVVDADWDGEGTKGFVVAPVCDKHARYVSTFLAGRAATDTMAERVPAAEFPRVVTSFHTHEGLCKTLGMHFLAGTKDQA